MDHQKLNKEIAEALKNWKLIVKNYQIPSTKKAVIQIVNTFLPFLGLWTLMYFSLQRSIWITIPLAIINAFFLVRIFIIQHDCGHQSFTKSRKVNNILGYVCSIFSALPYKYWAKVHNFHHAHAGMIETHEIGDIPTLTVEEYRSRNWFGKLSYRIFRNPIVTFFIAPIYYIGISNKIPKHLFKNSRKEIWANIKDNCLIIAAYIALSILLGWKQFLIIQLMLIFTFGVIAFWFFYIQHQHEHSYKQFQDKWDYVVSAIRGSTYYKLPKVWQWLTGNIGIHHIHHLSSLIPNYNLEKCMKENSLLNKYVTEVTFWQSLKMISNKLWDEEKQKMISFKEYYLSEKLKMSC